MKYSSFFHSSPMPWLMGMVSASLLVGIPGCKENNVSSVVNNNIGQACRAENATEVCGAAPCVFGYCREACASDAECSGGSICLSDKTKAGGCSLVAESRCSTTALCPTNLVCAPDNQCRTPCSDSLACPRSDQVCVGQACVGRSEGKPVYDASTADVSQGSSDASNQLDSNIVHDAQGDASNIDAGQPLPDDASSNADSAASDGGNGAPDASGPDSPAACLGIKPVVQVALGRLHSCARLCDGTLKCWGNNDNGQIGVGSSPAIQQSPALVTNRGAKLADVVDVAAGADFTCATLKPAGQPSKVLCWGGNNEGQLGNGSFGTAQTSPSPVMRDPVEPLVNVRTLSAGIQEGLSGGHICALLDSGAVACWGRAQEGQCGNGTGKSIEPFASLVSVPQASSLAAGGSHTCSVDADTSKTVRCWGSNLQYQCGVSTSMDPVQVPNVVAQGDGGLFSGTTSISSGSRQTCVALGATGLVHCWGQDFQTTSLLSPQYAGIARASQVAVAATHACALLTDSPSGAIKCWGSNYYGQLANGNAVDSNIAAPEFVVTDPSTFAQLSGATQVAVGAGHTCAVLGDGSLWCWGYNQYGQLGIGTKTGDATRCPTTQCHPVPQKVPVIP